MATYLENSVPSGGRNARRGVQFRLCMAGTASGDAAAVGTAPQNEWDVVDRTHHQLMTELGVLDKYVSPAMELASKKASKHVRSFANIGASTTTARFATLFSPTLDCRVLCSHTCVLPRSCITLHSAHRHVSHAHRSASNEVRP